jgi:hypothetical protein
VLRNPDADHLISPTLKLGFFKSNLYDIQLFTVLLLILAVFAAKKFIRKTFCKQATALKAPSSKKSQ